MTHIIEKLFNATKLATIAVLLASLPTQSQAQEQDAQIFLLDIQELVGQSKCQNEPQISQNSVEPQNLPQNSNIYNVNIVPEAGVMPEQKVQPTPQKQEPLCEASFGESTAIKTLNI